MKFKQQEQLSHSRLFKKTTHAIKNKIFDANSELQNCTCKSVCTQRLLNLMSINKRKRYQ